MPSIANEDIETKMNSRLMSKIYKQDEKKVEVIEDRIKEISNKLHSMAYDFEQKVIKEVEDLAKYIEKEAEDFKEE